MQSFSQSSLDTGSYSNKTSYPVVKAQRDVFTGDLDGDGKPDMVIAYADTNIIGIYRNTGTPKHFEFEFQGNYTLAAYDAPGNIAAGDLDGDGKIDLVISNEFTRVLSVFRNTSSSGNIGFADAINYRCGTTAAAAAIADLNGDGKPEIIVANSGDFSIGIYRNTGSTGVISFAASTELKLSTYPMNIVAADIDGDGKIDIATQNYDVSTLSVYRNTTNKSDAIGFASKKDFTTDAGPTGLRVGDVDGDGKPDLVTVNYDAGSISVLRNTSKKGTVSFAGRKDEQISSTPMGISIADLDGDGRQDLVITDMNDNSVSVLRNTGGEGDPAYGSGLSYGTDAVPHSVITADLDGDGKPELATANLYAPSVSVLHGNENAVSTTDSSQFRVSRTTVATSFTVYPNPTTSYVNVSVPNANYASQFKVVDMMGRVLQIAEVPAGTQQATVDFSQFARGAYILVWSDGINVSNQRIIKQ